MSTTRDHGSLRANCDVNFIQEHPNLLHAGSDEDDNKDGERNSLMAIRCLICSSIIFRYSSDVQNPLNSQPGGKYYLDCAEVVLGNEKITKLRDSSELGDFSDLFNVVLKFGQMRQLRLRRASNDSEGSDDILGDSSIGNPEGAESEKIVSEHTYWDRSSVFHMKAQAEVKRGKQDLDTDIVRMRAKQDAKAMQYMREADFLARKLKPVSTQSPVAAQARTKGRGISSKAISKSSSPGQNSSSQAVHLSPSPIIIKGGFDTAFLESPSRPGSSKTSMGSHPVIGTLAYSSHPVTSPFLASSGNYPALFGNVGKSNSPVPLAHAQPNGPQSPTMRRSRSPSPSRDTSRHRSSSRTNKSNAEEREVSEEFASTDAGPATKRPALDLDRDVLKQEEDLHQGNAGETDTERGRASNRTMTSRNEVRTKKTGNAWLRLNGLSPDRPDAQAKSALPTRESEGTGKAVLPEKSRAEEQEVIEGGDQHITSNSARRHVSFKEPESLGSSKYLENGVHHEVLDAEGAVHFPLSATYNIN